MASSRENSLCCGGGGGRIWIDSGKDKGFSHVRKQQAIETGADVLAVSCPYCLLTLEASNMADSENSIEVKDIAELVWAAM
jgi:Fe-S oxidoreductase